MTKKDEFFEATAIDFMWGKFMEDLFGRIPSDEELPTLEVTRSEYTKKMKAVQERFKLKQGDRRFMPWIITCVGRSPQIIEDEEGDGDGENDTNAN